MLVSAHYDSTVDCPGADDDATGCVSGTDTVDQLDHEFSTRVVQATVGAAADARGPR